MTTNLELARRWMKCESFEWKEGMGTIDSKGRSWRLFVGYDSALYGKLEYERSNFLNIELWTGEWAEIIDAVPDLKDDATLRLLRLTSMTAMPNLVDVEQLVDILEDSS